MSLLQAAKQALEAIGEQSPDKKLVRAAFSLQEAIELEENKNHTEEWFVKVKQAEQYEPKCNPHPDAPHGFDRTASHNMGRYVCDCEGWEPEQADGEKWSPDDMAYRPGGLSMEQAEQEPVAWMSPGKERLEFSRKDTVYGSHTIPLYAAPVRTKDLTDDDIFKTNKTELPDCQDLVDFARAVIAADREKNK